MKIKHINPVIFLLLSFIAAVHGQQQTACSVTAYISDLDPKGLNVRSGAGADFETIGAIPFSGDGTAVDITASSGKWVKISGARNAEGDRVFSRSGWVYASLLAVSIGGGGRDGTAAAYATASKTSKVVARLPVDTQYALESCAGSWMKISIAKKDKMIPGWIPNENQCGNPWTTCP
jgi:SH3-like domain-containing protein